MTWCVSRTTFLLLTAAVCGNKRSLWLDMLCVAAISAISEVSTSPTGTGAGHVECERCEMLLKERDSLLQTIAILLQARK